MPSGRGAPWRAMAVVASLAVAPHAATLAQRDANPPQRATVSDSKLIHYKSRSFRIPVTVPDEVRDLVREVRLWVSDDYGYHWKQFGVTSPDRPEFPFKATRDAEYWFAIQTVDTQGKVYPADDSQAEPSLRVVVDTAPPTLILEPAGRRGSLVAVRWEASDENLVRRSLTLEFQPERAGALEWRSVPLSERDFRLTGSKSWDTGTGEPIRVRATVLDRAKNSRQVEIVLADGSAELPGSVAASRDDWNAPPRVAPISSRSLAGDGDFGANDPLASLDRGQPPSSDEHDFRAGNFGGSSMARGGETGPRPDQSLLVGSPRFPLQYEVADAGPNGIARVQLWVTHDGGRTWYPQAEDNDKTSPYPVDLRGEGTFGLWLAVQGASGLGDPPPTSGDRPQIWVEIDSTPPVVQVESPRLGTGASTGKILILWHASDPHLAARPVTLSYRAEGSSDPWTRIAGPIENSGQFIWVVPPGVPPRFRVRIEVDDSLGHRGAAESGPILVDRTRPKGRIIGLDPTARMGENLQR